MIFLENEKLNKYTSIHIGGLVKEMYTPESAEELLEIIQEKSPKFFLGGGSNLLINDRDFDLVINLKSFDSSIDNLGNGIFRVGASVRLQQLINTINNAGYGGIEYLFSVPGLVGGAIVMNAGRGREYKKSISDYILSVTVIKDCEFVTMNKNECKFNYRDSIFKNSSIIVTSVLFEFPEMNKDDSTKAKQERIELCKKNQDSAYPNFGTVFMQANPTIMYFVKKLKLGGKRVHFSGKTSNWIINENNGTYKDTIQTIKKVEWLHKLFRKTCQREFIIWQ